MTQGRKDNQLMVDKNLSFSSLNSKIKKKIFVLLNPSPRGQSVK
jgi:hypothetical protein